MKINRRFIKIYFDLLYEMTHKEVTVRYKQASFGFLWIVLNPLLQMIIMGVVFSDFIKVPDYFTFLFSGLLPWQFFSLSLTKTTPCIIYEKMLIQKSNFPREIIPLSIIFSNLINFVVSEILLIAFILIEGKIHQNTIPLIVIPTLWITLLVTGIGLLCSSLDVIFRDVNFFVQTIIMIWFYATPILYPSKLAPKSLEIFFLLNPLTVPFSMFQSSISNDPIPDIKFVVSNLIISGIFILFGIIIFKKHSPTFTDHI